MTAPYPLPTNISGVSGMGDYANQVTGGLWGLGIMIAATTILYVVLAQKYSNRTSIVSTGVLMATMAILWRFAGQISDFVMFTFIIFGYGSILYFYFVKDDYVE